MKGLVTRNTHVKYEKTYLSPALEVKANSKLLKS